MTRISTKNVLIEMEAVPREWIKFVRLEPSGKLYRCEHIDVTMHGNTQFLCSPCEFKHVNRWLEAGKPVLVYHLPDAKGKP